jgi:predicted ATP-grasp superfamily ATP-dependent carboligase
MKYIDDATKAEVDKLLDLQTRINLAVTKEKVGEEAEAIEKDQERLRENIEKLKKHRRSQTINRRLHRQS